MDVERGPLVYCAEHPDNNFDIFATFMNQRPTFEVKSEKLLVNSETAYPIVTLKTDVQTLEFNSQGKLETKDQALTLIPYYAWCHRGNGKMRVWLPQDLSVIR